MMIGCFFQIAIHGRRKSCTQYASHNSKKIDSSLLKAAANAPKPTEAASDVKLDDDDDDSNHKADYLDYTKPAREEWISVGVRKGAFEKLLEKHSPFDELQSELLKFGQLKKQIAKRR